MAVITITKLGNGNVEITGVTSPYTLLPTMGVYRDNSGSDGVEIADGVTVDRISASDVLLVTGGSGDINNPTGDQLYTELKENFFNA